MIAALIGVGGAFMLALMGGFWHLGSKLGKIETRLDNLPTMSDLHRTIRNHSDRCPGSKGEVSGVFAAIPERPRP